VKYRLPYKLEGKDYKLLIQKQPGTDMPLYTMVIGSKEDEFFLRTDSEVKYRI
jgi:hypothetical protein